MNDGFNFFGLGALHTPYDFKDKELARQSYIVYMLNRVMSMFEYNGLPDTIPQKILELYLMVNGHSVIIKHNDNLYVCFGNWGGEPNEYYIPKNYIVANPYLNLFNTYTLGEDAVLAYNDSLYYGLMPMFNRYSSLLVENDITMRMVDINTRVAALIDAKDDTTYASAEKFLHDIEAGESGVIGSPQFFDGIATQPYGDSHTQQLTDLIEFHQYTKASWFNELGLNANYNMKREAITANESQLNDDMLMPLVDNMLNCRKLWIEQVNEMFGTDITIDWASSWEDNYIENELAHEIMNAEAENSGQSENEKEVNDEKTDEDNSKDDVSDDD